MIPCLRYWRIGVINIRADMDSGGFLAVGLLVLAAMSVGFIVLFIYIGEQLSKKHREREASKIPAAARELPKEKESKQPNKAPEPTTTAARDRAL